jgi:hypothetical protein
MIVLEVFIMTSLILNDYVLHCYTSGHTILEVVALCIDGWLPSRHMIIKDVTWKSGTP